LFVRCSVRNKPEVTFIDISKEKEQNRQLLHHLASQYAAELQPSAFLTGICQLLVTNIKWSDFPCTINAKMNGIVTSSQQYIERGHEVFLALTFNLLVPELFL